MNPGIPKVLIIRWRGGRFPLPKSSVYIGARPFFHGEFLEMLDLERIFGTIKPIIGMVHLAPLPASPFFNPADYPEKIVHRALSDVRALQRGGIDGILFSNEGDRPYSFKVGPETVSSMAFVIGRVFDEIEVPFGVDVIWDPYATIGLAKAVGANFARTIVSGSFASDLGIIDVKGGEVLRYRKRLGAEDIPLFAYINPEFGVPLGGRDVATIAKGLSFLSVADVFCVSGPRTGTPPTVDDIRSVKEAVPDVPVFLNTGANKENITSFLEVVDGVIVGTSLKKGGITWNPVDEARVKEFMEVVRRARR